MWHPLISWYSSDTIFHLVHHRHRLYDQTPVNYPRARLGRIPEYRDPCWYPVHCRYPRSLLHYLSKLTIDTERRNVKIINAPAGTQQNPYLLTEEEEKKTLRKHEEHKQQLRVPRRPPWSKSMTTAQLDRQEKDAFLDWRRGLAQCVSLVILSPPWLRPYC